MEDQENEVLPPPSGEIDPTEIPVAEAPKDPLQEDLEGVPEISKAESEEADVSMPNEMAQAISDASEGRISYDDAWARMISTGSAQAIREVAATSVVKDMQVLRERFDRSAAEANLTKAEGYARMMQAHQDRMSKPQSELQTRITVMQDAATTIATSEAPTYSNNTIEELTYAAQTQGFESAVSHMVMDKLVQKYGANNPGIKEFMGYLGVYAGIPIAAARFGGVKAGALATLTTGAMYAYEAFGLINNAVKKVTGIESNEALDYVGQAELLRSYLKTLPIAKQQEVINNITEEIANSTFLPGSMGHLQAIMASAKLYDKVGSEAYDEGKLPMAFQQQLDRLFMAVDGLFAVKDLHKAVSTVNTMAKLKGGASVGAKLADDVLKNTNTTGATGTDVIALSSSMDVTQFMEHGITGAASSFQKSLREATDKLMSSLDDRIRVGDAEAVATKEFFQTHFAPTELRVASVNMQSGDVLIQHASGKPFMSEANATKIAELYKQHGLSVEIVPATHNAGARLARTTDELAEDKSFASHHMDALSETYKEVDMMGQQLTGADIANTILHQPDYTHLITGATHAGKDLKEVAKFLNKGDLLENVQVKFVKGWDDVIKARLGKNASPELVKAELTKLRSQAGVFDPFTNTVYVQDVFKTSPTLMLHELGHARIAGTLEIALSKNDKLMKAAGITTQQRAAAENMQTLFEYALDNATAITSKGDEVALSKLYGGTNVHEMASEILTNDFLRNALKNTKVDADTLAMLKITDASFVGKVRTAWDAFVNLLGKALGWKAGDDVFSHFLDQFSRLSKDVKASQQDMVATLLSQGIPREQLRKIFTEEKYQALSHGYYIRAKFPTTTATHTAHDIETRMGWGLDPLHRASYQAVNDRYVALLAEGKDRKALTDFVKQSYVALNTTERRVVEQVLKDGEDLGREFTYVDLMARGANDAVADAYLRLRTASFISHRVKDQAVIRSYAKQGFSQGYITVGGQRLTSPMQPVSIDRFEGKMAWDMSQNKLVKVTSTSHPTGFFVESATKIDIGGESITRFVGNPSDFRFGALQSQIPYRAGSFRRIYTDDYFAKVSTKEMVNGEWVESSYHIRTARSGKDMDEYVKGMNSLVYKWRAGNGLTMQEVERAVGRWEDSARVLQDFNAGKYDNLKEVNPFESHYNREATDYTNMYTSGAMDDLSKFMRERGEKLRPLEEGHENTLSIMDSMQAELTNVSRVRNLGEWREKYVDMWWNSFKDILPEEIRRMDNPVAAMTSMEGKMYTRSDQTAKFAESQRKYILQQLGTSTLDEKWVESALRRVTSGLSIDSKLLGMPVGKMLVPAGHVLRNTDPLQLFRSLNFTMMLGMFNPAQLFVQSLGMSTAIMLHPIHGAKAAYTMPLLRLALHSDNPAVWSHVSKMEQFAKAGFSNPQEFVDLVKAVRKTGLLDGIQSTSLHGLQDGQFNMFSKWKGNLSNVNTFWFDRGEEVARLVSFDVARREFMTKNPGVAWNSSNALKNILERTDDFTQNMSKANTAFYQRGVLSIPFQFLQYNLKLGTNVMGGLIKGGGRGFTREEAAKIMLGHVVTYGMAGSGLTFMWDEVKGGVENFLGRKLSDDERLAMSQGTLAAVINAASEHFTGESTKLATGSRFGVGEFYEKMIKGIYHADGVKLVDAMGGPTTATMKRLGAFNDLFKVLYHDPSITVDDLVSVLNLGMQENIAGWRNATKAYYALNNNNRITTNVGEPLYKATKGEVLFTALGITSAGVNDYYMLQTSLRDREAILKDLAATYDKVHLIYLKELNENGHSQRAKELATFLQSLHPLNAGDKTDFQKLIHDGHSGVFVDNLSALAAKYLNGQYGLKDAALSSDVGGTITPPFAGVK